MIKVSNGCFDGSYSLFRLWRAAVCHLGIGKELNQFNGHGGTLYFKKADPLTPFFLYSDEDVRQERIFKVSLEETKKLHLRMLRLRGALGAVGYAHVTNTFIRGLNRAIANGKGITMSVPN